MSFIDNGDELVSVPESLVKGIKTHVDGSILFKMVGGPYHGMTLRVEAPFDRVVFKVRGQVIVYRLRPPHNSKDKWVYGYDALDDQDFTEAERGFRADDLNDKWIKASEWLAREKRAEQERFERKQNELRTQSNNRPR